jgi:putative endopeptidase
MRLTLPRLLLPLLLASPVAAFDPAFLAPATPACADFYGHANGSWLAATPAPAGHAGYGVPELLAERSRDDRRALLDHAARAPQDAIDGALGRLWASLLREELAEASASAALAPWLRRIETAASTKQLVDLLAAAQSAGLPMLFRLSVDIDSGQPDRRILYALQGGLGLPERDYYLRHEPGAAALRGAYLAYLQTLLTHTGDAEPEAGAQRVLELETRLARASQSLLQLRDPAVSRRLVRVRELDRQFPNLEWRRLLKAMDLGKVELVSLGHVAFFTEANAALAQVPIEHWRAYFRAQLAHQLAPWLQPAVAEAHHALFAERLRGRAAPPRWQQALDTVQALLGPELDARYRAAHLGADTEARFAALADGLREVLRERIAASPDLGETARAAALAKLDALRIGIAQAAPRDAATLPALSPEDPAANLLALLALQRRAELGRIGAAAAFEPPVALALPWIAYEPGRNRLRASPALLQPPLLPEGDEAALLFGGLGVLLAHELSHGFDRFGARFDARGQLAPWWGPVEQAADEALGTALMGQYDAYPLVGDVTVDGRRTLAENQADLAGLELAYLAWAARAAADPPDAEGRSAAQRFFLAFAQAQRRAERDESLRLSAATAAHAPARWRVNGPLANHPGFASAFGCEAGQGLVRAGSEQLSVWR